MWRLLIQPAAILLIAACATAKRMPPKPVAPVISNGIRYSAEGDGVDQYIVATDVASCDVLWKARIFHNDIWSWMEPDMQHHYITGLKLSGNSLVIAYEGFGLYCLDLTTRRVHELWPAGIFAHQFPAPAAGESRSPACSAEIVWPGDIRSSGQPETTLWDVTVGRTSLPDVIKRVPASASRKSYSPGAGVSLLAWDEAGARIHVSFVGQIAHAVSVSGSPSPNSKTGRGLAIGQSMDDIERIYGQDWLWEDDGVHLRWNDGTELRVHLASRAPSARITSVELIASFN